MEYDLTSAQLFIDDANGPPNGSAHWLRSSDGIRLRVASWRQSEAKGTVFVFPGRSDYIEQYGRFVSSLHDQGYGCLVIDWRGQGASDRLSVNPMLGHVTSFLDYQHDVRAMLEFAEQTKVPKPWYLVAHSMGGCIGLRSVIEGFPCAACAFTAPMWQIVLPPVLSSVALPLSCLLTSVGRAEKFAPGVSVETYVNRVSFNDNTLTNDVHMYEHWRNLAGSMPQHQVGGPSVGWLHAALVETRALSRLSAPSVPALAFYGGEDVTVGFTAIEEKYATWDNGSIVFLPKAKHEILQETPDVRARVLDEMMKLFERNAL